MALKDILKEAGIDNPDLEAKLEREITVAQDKSGYVPKERFNEVNKKWRELEATHSELVTEHEALKSKSGSNAELSAKITEYEAKIQAYETEKTTELKSRWDKYNKYFSVKQEENKELFAKIEPIKGKFVFAEEGKELTNDQLRQNLNNVEILETAGFFTEEERKSFTSPPANHDETPKSKSVFSEMFKST